MKIAVVTDIHVGTPLKDGASTRAASHLALSHLPSLFKYISETHRPDLVVNLGDLIRSESPEYDLARIQEVFSHFSHFSCPKIHVLGNHDIRILSEETLKKFSKEESYGIKKMGGIGCLWLGLQRELINGKEVLSLPQEQLEWLEKILEKEPGPLLLFSHCPLDNHETKGNFFQMQGGNSLFFLNNQQEISALLSKKKNIYAVFQAHLHYFHIKRIAHIPYISLPAMVENLCAPDAAEHFPDIYTLIEFSPPSLVVKCYSRRYAFAGAEF